MDFLLDLTNVLWNYSMKLTDRRHWTLSKSIISLHFSVMSPVSTFVLDGLVWTVVCYCQCIRRKYIQEYTSRMELYPLHPSGNLIFGSGSKFSKFSIFWSSKEPWAKNTFQSFRIRGLGLTKINSKPFRASLPKNIPANSTVFTPEDDRMFPENNQFSNKKGVLESCP